MERFTHRVRKSRAEYVGKLVVERPISLLEAVLPHRNAAEPQRPEGIVAIELDSACIVLRGLFVTSQLLERLGDPDPRWRIVRRPIDGHKLDESVEIYGDEIERVVAWQAGSDVSTLAGKPVRIRVVMKDADLYSIRFR